MTDAPRPPAHLAAYVEVLGADDAADFLLRFGGAECYFTDDPKGRSAVARMVGVERTRALAAALGVQGGKVRIPTGNAWLAAHLVRQGLPVAEIARRLHANDVTVRRWLRAGPAAGQTGRRKSRGGPLPRRDPRQITLL